MDQKDVKRQIKNYIKPVKKLLDCSKKNQQKLYSIMEESAREYLENTSHAESAALKEYWGDPASLIKNYMDTLEPQERGRATRAKKKILVFSVFSLALILLLALYLLFYHAGKDITLVYYDVC